MTDDTPMTLQSLLEELERLNVMATPGPWRSLRSGNSFDGKRHCAQSRIEGVPRTFHERAFLHQVNPHLLTLRDEDADLISALRTSLPYLLDVLKAGVELEKAAAPLIQRAVESCDIGSPDFGASFEDHATAAVALDALSAYTAAIQGRPK